MSHHIAAAIRSQLVDVPQFSPTRTLASFHAGLPAGGLARSSTILRPIDRRAGWQVDRPVIFLSHATLESPIALILKESIDSAFAGLVDVFVSDDVSSVGGGSKWLDEISKALRLCVIELVLASPHSIGRPWINFEVGGGWVREIPVVPVCHSGLDKAHLPLPFGLLQGANVTDADDLRTFVFGAIASAIGGKTPTLDYEALAARLRAAEQALATASTEAELGSLRSAPILALRSLSADRRQLEVAVFDALLRLQGIRASGGLPANAERMATDLDLASQFWREPASFEDVEVSDLRAELERLISTVQGSEGPRFGAAGEVTSTRAQDPRLETLRELRDLNRDELKTGEIKSLDVAALADRLRVSIDDLRDTLADMLADGTVEPHYATFRNGPMDGALSITKSGLAELGRSPSASMTSKQYASLQERARRFTGLWNELKTVEISATRPPEIRALVSFREYAAADLDQLSVVLAAITTAPENLGIEFLDDQIRLAERVLDDLRGMIKRANSESASN
jgi:hypothetical protein